MTNPVTTPVTTPEPGTPAHRAPGPAAVRNGPWPAAARGRARGRGRDGDVDLPGGQPAQLLTADGGGQRLVQHRRHPSGGEQLAVQRVRPRAVPDDDHRARRQFAGTGRSGEGERRGPLTPDGLHTRGPRPGEERPEQRLVPGHAGDVHRALCPCQQQPGQGVTLDGVHDQDVGGRADVLRGAAQQPGPAVDAALVRGQADLPGAQAGPQQPERLPGVGVPCRDVDAAARLSGQGLDHGPGPPRTGRSEMQQDPLGHRIPDREPHPDPRGGLLPQCALPPSFALPPAGQCSAPPGPGQGPRLPGRGEGAVEGLGPCHDLPTWAGSKDRVPGSRRSRP